MKTTLTLAAGSPARTSDCMLRRTTEASAPMKGKVQALRRSSKAAPVCRGGLGPGTFRSTRPRFCSGSGSSSISHIKQSCV